MEQKLPKDFLCCITNELLYPRSTLGWDKLWQGCKLFEVRFALPWDKGGRGLFVGVGSIRPLGRLGDLMKSRQKNYQS